MMRFDLRQQPAIRPALRLTLVSVLLAVFNLPAATLYVSWGSTNATPPYTNWATAATVIQDAVDVANPGDQILVTNGLYQAGGHAIHGSNRVAVATALALHSVNGPAVTGIAGYQLPGSVVGSSAIRCVYLTNGATIEGFTLTNGATQEGGYGGGVYCEPLAVVTNCVLVDNSAYSGAGAYHGTLNNCLVISNFANYPGTYGGGVYNGSLNNCTVVGNVANVGGGTYLGLLNSCTISNNSAVNLGGGTSASALSNCMVVLNHAQSGGGAYEGALTGCMIVSNSAGASGSAGGLLSASATNCIITGNSAYYGGGIEFGSLNNCTIVSNYAHGWASGSYQGTLNNCVVYFNADASTATNHYQSTLNYCCTTPLPSSGKGNFTNQPLFLGFSVGDLHAQSNSPCINAGNNAYVTSATDLDGNPRIVSGNVDVGAYEYQGTGSVISYAWLQQYGLPTDGSADYADSDHDSMNNWQEWVCGTSPTNAQSALRLLSAAPSHTNANVSITWQSVAGVNYSLARSAILRSPFMLLATNIVGQAGTTSYTDTNVIGVGPFFYRVGVKSP